MPYRLLRIACAALGLAAFAFAALIPLHVYSDITRHLEWRKVYPPHFWDEAGIYTALFVSVALCVSTAYLCFRYAMFNRGLKVTLPRKTVADRFFRSLFAGCATFVIISIISQFVYLAAVARRPEAKELRVQWTPDVWQSVRHSPTFLFVSLVMFLSAFYWVYRRETRSEHRG
jgi:hypothetical protein